MKLFNNRLTIRMFKVTSPEDYSPMRLLGIRWTFMKFSYHFTLGIIWWSITIEYITDKKKYESAGNQ